MHAEPTFTATSAIPLRHKYWHAVILALAISPYFMNLGVSSLWDSNEAFYAETPREMIESGDYIIPRFNYYFRWQKPPLVYWAVVVSYRLFGISECSSRLPIALAAVSWILLCYWFGRIWAGRNTGLVAALIMAVNFRVFMMARRAITEIWLAYWISLCLALFAIVLIRKPRCSAALLAAAYTALGLAMMTKGPVAAVLAGGTVLAFMVWYRRWDTIRLLRPWMGLGILAAILVPWYWNVVSIVGWQPIKTFLLSDNFGRYLTEDFGPSRGPWYYPVVLMADFFPWSALGIAGILALKKKLIPLSLEQKTYGGWIIIWIFCVLFFFSLSRNKQVYYVLPLYLPLALLIAHVLVSPLSAAIWNRLRQGIYLSTAALSVSAGLLLAFGAKMLFPELSIGESAAAALCLVAMGAFLIYAGCKMQWLHCLAASIGLFWAVQLIMCWIVFPRWEQYKPVHQFAEIIQAQRLADDYCGYYKYSTPSLAFYLREPIFEIIWEDQIIHLLSNTRKRLFCIIEQEQFASIRPRLAQNYRIVASRPLLGFRARDIIRIGRPQENPQLLLISNAP